MTNPTRPTRMAQAFAQSFDATKTNPLRDPGPVCFVCGNNSPDAVWVEVRAYEPERIEQPGVSWPPGATTHIYGVNICLECLEHQSSCVGARLGHYINASAFAWRGRHARKKRT